jgi:hypothetical protein
MAVKGKSTSDGCDMTEEEIGRINAIAAGLHPDTGKPLCPGDEKTLEAPSEKAALRFFQFWAEGELCDLEDHFARDRNPVHVWEAFKFARRYGIKRPDWVENYLADVADLILEIRDEVAGGKPVGREADRVGKALGFVHNPGKTGWFELAANLKRDRAAYVEVRRRVAAMTKPEFAYVEVAKLMNISASTAGRSYRLFTKLRNELDKSEGEDGDA